MTSRRGALRCLIAAVLFGAAAPAASILAGEMPTLVLAGLLYLGAALAVLPAVARHRPDAAGIRAGWRPLAVAVLFGGALGPALLVAGLARIPAATGSLLLNFELVATMAIAAVVFREHLGRRLIGAAALIGAAGVLLVWQPGVAFDLGGLFIIGACVCWGIDNSVTARLDQLSPEQITFANGAVAGTVNLILGLIIATAAGIEIGQIVTALAIGALGYGASITLWVKGARDLGAARGQVIFAAAPFLGALLSWTVLHEAITAVQAIAVPIAAAGVALSLRTSHQHTHVHFALEHEHEHSHDDEHHDHVHTRPDAARHTHRHHHDPVEHAHDHVPDLHHGHAH
ncbi:MAG: DMT family transporter [Acidimicrobiales bacterium]